MFDIPLVVDAVASSRLLVDDGAESLVRVAHVNDEDMLACIIAVAQVEVREERLSRSRTAQNEGIVVVYPLTVASFALHINRKMKRPAGTSLSNVSKDDRHRADPSSIVI